MMLRHPPRTKLEGWLEGAQEPKVDAHVTTCAKCASRLEELARPVADVRAALAAVLRPPDDLVPRLQQGVRTRLERRQELGLMGQLLGLPWETTRLLMDEEQE